jgi:hypothetical protein
MSRSTIYYNGVLLNAGLSMGNAIIENDRLMVFCGMIAILCAIMHQTAVIMEGEK